MIGFGNLITDRFHRAILMMKSSDAPVVFVESVEKYPTPGSKGRELMESIGLADYVVRGAELKNLNGDGIIELLDKWSADLAHKRLMNLNNIETCSKEKLFNFLSNQNV